MVIVAEAIVGKELVTGIAGLIYTGMGVFNKTFCSLGSCSVSQRAAKNDAGIGGIKQIEK